MSDIGTALVIGATGGIGSEMARALVAHGWRVAALNRTPPSTPKDGIDWTRGDAMDPAVVASAAKGASVIVHAVNPAYYRDWRGLAIPMLANTIKAAAVEGALIVFPGNIYNFGPDAWPVIREDSPEHPVTRKGAVRVEMEAMLRNGAERGARALIVRAGDVFGGHSVSSNFSQVVVKAGKPLKRVVYAGKPAAGHAWAYTPDLAAATLSLIEMRDRLAAFEVVNFGGYWIEPGIGLADAVRAAADMPDLPVRRFPWPLVHLLSPFVRLFREIDEMRYLWDTPVRLDNSKLVSLIGTEPQTPLVEALRRTLVAIGCLPAAPG